MALQNLVSAILSAESKAEVQRCLSEVKKRLDFLTNMRSDDVRALFKAGKEYTPIFDKAYAVIGDYPQIIPSAFPMEEFKKDYALYKDLVPIASQIEQLSESLQKTLMALASDTLVESVEIYHTVKQHAEQIPGLDTVADDLAVYFARPRKASTAAKAASAAAAR
jgi:hypothetical protein